MACDCSCRADRLTLTEVGERLVEDTTSYFDLEEAIRCKLGEAYADKPPQIRIGSEHPSVTAAAVNDITGSGTIPGDYAIFGGSQDVLCRWFKERRVDLIVTYTPANEAEILAGKTTVLRTDKAEFVAGKLCAERMPKGDRASTIEDLLATETWILQKKGATTRRVFDEMCTRLDAFPKAVIEMPSYSDVMDAVKENLGIGILIRNAKNGKYYSQPIRELIPLNVALPQDLEPVFSLQKFIHCQKHAMKLDEVNRFIDHCLTLNPPENIT